MKLDIKAMSHKELTDLILELGEKRYRADQIYPFIAKGIEQIDDVPNIPKSLKSLLNEKAYLSKAKVYKKLGSKIDGTKKYLIELDDGNIIETVLMRYDHGNSICISTQVGCRMGCKFCASTIGGLARNLTAGEMLGQIITVKNDIGERISNIVLMGSGEPFDNMDQVVKFLEIVHEEKGLNIGYRHITISTCGVVPGIERLAELNLPVNLAISLHQTDQEKRQEIMPIANRYSIQELLEASKSYSQKTKRRVTYEYALIDGVNNNKSAAKDLAKLLRNSLSHVNLIPVNSIEGNSFQRPDEESVRSFLKELTKQGIEATIRRELGADISGACGQLKRSFVSEVDK
ncbi:MAG: 23S rRNA (adenine(2503)-C(2))-methyltransferase RlmN [Peptostreptococcaceae bacterium]|nr:23S rRNA (adenine(2503)-C(2))-methyltransferase RlmN [Peptostreptococcaceae bacterium]